MCYFIRLLLVLNYMKLVPVHFEVNNYDLVTLYLYNYNRIIFLSNIINGILLLYTVTGIRPVGPMKLVPTSEL